MHVIQDTIKQPIKTSLSDGINRTHGSGVANLLFKCESITINNVYSN